jgi:two-component system chemotaxis response regulator CheY
MKALVVESSSTMRSVLRRILTMRGFEVAEAENGQHALDVLRCMGEADLVLVDWVLHELDSLEFIARLRLGATPGMMVIMLVADAPGMRELHRAFIAGVDDYLMKPFTSLQIDQMLTQGGLT